MTRSTKLLGCSLAFLGTVACGDYDYDDQSNLHGRVNTEEFCGAPDQVAVHTCADTGICGQGHTGFQRGEFLEDLDVERHRFEAQLEPGPYLVRAVAPKCRGTEPFHIESGEITTVELDVFRHWANADAPNLYLYPQTPLGVRIRLPYPDDVLSADPPYPHDGWHVLATPTGRIHSSSGPRDYLFYETAVPIQGFQQDQGWCVDGSMALWSMETAMGLLGFLEPEIWDFGEFWDSELPDDVPLTIYPQVETLPWLGIRPAPDSLLRTWFVIRQGCHPVDAFEFEPVPRTGFHAAEWGIALLGPEQDGEGPLTVIFE
jgi:hypothetical protein